MIGFRMKIGLPLYHQPWPPADLDYKIAIPIGIAVAYFLLPSFMSFVKTRRRLIPLSQRQTN